MGTQFYFKSHLRTVLYILNIFTHRNYKMSPHFFSSEEKLVYCPHMSPFSLPSLSFLRLHSLSPFSTLPLLPSLSSYSPISLLFSLLFLSFFFPSSSSPFSFPLSLLPPLFLPSPLFPSLLPPLFSLCLPLSSPLPLFSPLSLPPPWIPSFMTLGLGIEHFS